MSTARWALAAMAVAFALRLVPHLGAPLRNYDEAHHWAAAARLVADGGPLYGNVLVSKGPVTYWMASAAFAVGGVYNVAAVRVAAVLWWVATGLVVY
ncbi:MAG: hypothetical protein ACOC8D_02605, partial [bacterium]